MGKDEDPSSSGWISLWRKIMETPFYQESKHVHLWLHLLLKANHKDKEILVNGKPMIIKRGQFLTSRKKLAEETGINESKIQRILKYFKNEQQIEQQATNKFRLISVLNYKEYQNPEQQSEQQLNSKRTATEHQLNTTNNEDNEDNENNTPGDNNLSHAFQEFWNLYPKKRHPDVTEAEYMKVAKEHGPEILMKALIGYMHYKQDEAKRKSREVDPDYFKQPENFLEKNFWKQYVDYRPEGPQL